MTEREYVPLEIIAYRLEGEDSWRVGETQRDIHAFKADLVASGAKVTEVRSVMRGAQRAGLKEDDGRLNDIGYHMVIGQGWTWDDVACSWRAPEEMVRQIPGEPAVVDDVEVTFGAADKGEEMVRFADYAKTNQRPDGMVETPDPEFTVPEEFDSWDDARRLTFINELLDEVVTPYDATNLRTLRSQAIEDFLGASGTHD